MAAHLPMARAQIIDHEGAGRESPVTDEKRAWALMAIQARADRGDEAAVATLAAVERLFARAACIGEIEPERRAVHPFGI